MSLAVHLNSCAKLHKILNEISNPLKLPNEYSRKTQNGNTNYSITTQNHEEALGYVKNNCTVGCNNIGGKTIHETGRVERERERERESVLPIRTGH